ncbi:alkaline phosphatase family protein [Salinisphaera sp.]|uniref:alkaline phosphatase family protein n=1 Tax=Salinisphaera sp. TaxID=1914330 RepID=UPI002D7A3BD7|nr:alkaline phosphatase family protein [Salinisphaera sp.]HET7313974.1 alkaline phosphatase family protein [Salinisphaera sp.]
MTAESPPALPTVLAGPILRRVEPNRIGLWLVTSAPIPLMLALYRDDDGQDNDQAAAPDDRIDLHAHDRVVAVGRRAYVHLIDVDLEAAGVVPLPGDAVIGYDLWLGERQASLVEHEPALCYEGEARPRFVLRQRLTHILHGSCRRPHHDSADGLARADRWLAGRRANPDDWPGQLLLTGDQIYADDVAGPLLAAIHATSERLGLWPETLEGATVADSDALYASPHTYYERDKLLPKGHPNAALRDRFFGGTRKPVFTSACSGNHLITFAEVLAMYLLTWSDALWRELAVTPPRLADAAAARYREEQAIIDAFVAELPAARRVLAHVPTSMIFDDHDITDDWNLSAEWEDSAYGHPFSRRIIGNALIAYTLCQGWSNTPDVFAERLAEPLQWFSENSCAAHQDQLIDALLGFDRWHYTLDTEPRIVVLDTRMHRWRRLRKTGKPSGLMDWESLTEMQSELIGRSAAVIVSPAPIFGVKLVENMQRVFTWFGKPLMVDAENWMAHRGAAVAMLQILSHRKTPENFTILSGDVHYSFVYDVTLRHVRTRQKIWQIVSSGVKNEFPARLLRWFDRLNRWLYSPWSPLNWFTKRRRLRVSPRHPQTVGSHRRLVNEAGMGYVGFNDRGQPVTIIQLGANDQDTRFSETGDLET